MNVFIIDIQVEEFFTDENIDVERDFPLDSDIDPDEMIGIDF